MKTKRFITLLFCLLLWSTVHSAQNQEDGYEKKACINELLRFMNGVSKKNIILLSPKAGMTKRGKYHLNALQEGIQLRKAQIKAKLFFKGTMRDITLNCSPVLKGPLSNPVIELTFLTATGEKRVLIQNSELLKQNHKILEFEFKGPPPLDFDDLAIKLSGRLKIHLLRKEHFETSVNMNVSIWREEDKEKEYLNGCSLTDLKNMLQLLGIQHVAIPEQERIRREKTKKDLVIEAMTFIKDSNAHLSLVSPKARIKSRGKHRIDNLKEGIQLRKEKISSKILLEGSTRELIISCAPLLKGELSNPVIQIDLTSTLEKETIHKVITINCVPLEQKRKLMKFELPSQRFEMNGLVLKISGILNIFPRGKKFFEITGEASLDISREKEVEESFLNGLSMVDLKNIVQPFGIDFVFIAPGTFLMGSENKKDEKPIHSIVLTKGFYMQTTEVTQLQWRQVMGTSPSHFKGDNRPVENISGKEIDDFLQKLNALGRGYFRLPSEAEWEYACRSGSTGEYAGNIQEMAWYEANSKGETHDVACRLPNAWGLYDMHGNVRERCYDWFNGRYYKEAPASDPMGPHFRQTINVIDGVFIDAEHHRPDTITFLLGKVCRGGGYDSKAEKCRSTYREMINIERQKNLLQFSPFMREFPLAYPYDKVNKEERKNDLGFRLVRIF